MMIIPITVFTASVTICLPFSTGCVAGFFLSFPDAMISVAFQIVFFNFIIQMAPLNIKFFRRFGNVPVIFIQAV